MKKAPFLILALAISILSLWACTKDESIGSRHRATDSTSVYDSSGVHHNSADTSTYPGDGGGIDTSGVGHNGTDTSTHPGNGGGIDTSSVGHNGIDTSTNHG